MKIKLKIREKLLIPLIGLMLPLLIGGFILFSVISQKRVLTDIQNMSDYKMELIQGEIRNIALKSLAMASSFASIEGIEKAYAMKNEAEGRNLIRELTAGYIENLVENTGLKSIKAHYHKPPAKSFIRVWRKPGEKDGGTT